MARQCQSCGMPLQTNRAGDCRGTEADGSLSDMWCSLCYREGRFVDPDCTREQMASIVDGALRDQGRGRLFRWFARSQLGRLERWQP